MLLILPLPTLLTHKLYFPSSLKMLLSPDFPKHRSSFQSHQHGFAVGSPQHLHLSCLDDVHLTAYFSLQGTGELAGTPRNRETSWMP